MKLKWQRVSRKTHFWGAALCALPVLLIVTTGLLLQVKKQFTWIQPTTMKTTNFKPELGFDDILLISQSVPEVQISNWGDIKRLDVRPGKGIIKVQSKNNWELQLDQGDGSVLAVNYRRSDIIESLHDGSYFFSDAKIYLFLPAAIILLWLCVSGIYMFLKTLSVRRRHRQKLTLRAGTTPSQIRYQQNYATDKH